jgi:hypothetical protein
LLDDCGYIIPTAIGNIENIGENSVHISNLEKSRGTIDTILQLKSAKEFAFFLRKHPYCCKNVTLFKGARCG